ncbi:TPA: helix-turn-helix transcriptional regulator [Salmonella enterica subsp. enterica serovar Give]|uniref:helix-turn-helix transcriptional regulator n=1 Tax=Salmonella enterica TaxID=28901 RepID=UPI0012CD9127|nr:AraC family transcriptional regulator [Salmonella enterica]ECC2950016.1 AraC family transcriptional regulator [Salmonella enterica subsp. enterica serovar Glostrup]EDW6338711.1 helix-turn-helix transcriptional regulator [Salmonella enterica subsp. enterica serovar Hadar]HCB5320451.1 helix-turn-helix transcriptional regulator [Salmonella enterica subsp. enterica serovar Give]HCM7197281.1 helix-turn-helix transcriptional regulator [Salmonella enterica subsp. enterica serovar Typhimurium str. D
MNKVKTVRNDISIGFYSSNIDDLTQDIYIETPLPFFYFIYTKGNDFKLSINGKKIFCKKNQGVFINKSVPFAILLHWSDHNILRSDINIVRLTSSDISEHNLWFDHDFIRLKEMSSGVIDKNYFLFDFSELDDTGLMAVSWIISQCSQEYTCREEIASEKLYRKIKVSFLLSYFMNINSDVSNIFHSASVTLTSERVASLVMSDYSKNWSLEELADNLLMSSSSLKKKMYKEIGSVTAFINKLKLTESLRRLIRTNDSISTIANSLGYKSPSYFTRIFKKYLKLHPMEIRLRKKRHS